MLSSWTWLLLPLLYVIWKLCTEPGLWELHHLAHVKPHRYPFRIPRRRRPPSAVSASQVLIVLLALLPTGLAITFTRGFRLFLNGQVRTDKERIARADGLVIRLLRGFFAAVAWVAALLLWLSSEDQEL